MKEKKSMENLSRRRFVTIKTTPLVLSSWLHGMCICQGSREKFNEYES
jgi:hypothetical protein